MPRPPTTFSPSPNLLVSSTIVLWSFGSLLARLVAIQSQFVLLSISFFFSFITLLIYLLVSKGFSAAWFRKIKPGYWLIGPLGYFFYSVAITQSSRAFDSISETTILNAAWPIFTVIFSDLIFIRSKKSISTRWLEGAGIALGLFSIIVLTTGGDLKSIQLDPVGIFWGLAAGMAYGLFGAYSGTLNDADQRVFLLVAITLSLLLIAVPAAVEIRSIAPVTPKDILVAFALGGLLDGAGYILWTRAIRVAKERNVRISTIASLMFLLPFINLFIVKLALKENQLTQPIFLLSLCLILTSTLIIQKAEAIPGLFLKSQKVQED